MPKKVDEYFKDIKKKNPDYDDSKAWATAWSIYCKYKNPESDHCQRSPSGYFKKKKNKGKKNKKSSLNEWFKEVAKETIDMVKDSSHNPT